jgi:ABC-type sulfate transport system substrate-binding protein
MGRKVKLEDSEDEEDQDFIQKLLKDTEVKKAGAQTSQKIEINKGGGVELIKQ